MPFGIGRGNKHKEEKFVPTEGEKKFLAPFLVDSKVSFLDVKQQILEREDIFLDRREKLGEWFRDERGKAPKSGAERIDF